MKTRPPLRRDTHIKPEHARDQPGIDAQLPHTMARAEDDVLTRARSPEFTTAQAAGAMSPTG